MERKRCQVCDGPVVNGRCKLCGMPYRNDETLYHLNENRSDHYRHATSRARAMMRQEEIPLGDKKPGSAGTYKACAQTAAAKKNASGNKAAGTAISKLRRISLADILRMPADRIWEIPMDRNRPQTVHMPRTIAQEAKAVLIQKHLLRRKTAGLAG